MQRVTLSLLAVLFTVSQAVTFSQAKPSPGGVLLSAEDQQALWKLTAADKNNDQGALVVDIGPYNIGINVQHRVTPNADPVGGKMAFHEKVSEIYYVTDGAGTMVTAGGEMSNIERGKYSTEQVRSNNGNGMVGPGGSAVFKDAPKSAKLKRGDVFIVPPNTGHYLSQVDGSFRYLVFRVDPEHTLPAGFVNKYIKK
jgi:mannose-6-phosphate isomerase-like protein (cupin superfamily)